MRQPVREIFDATARLVVDERRRAPRSARDRRRLRAPCRASAICACNRCIVSTRLRMSARSSSTVSNSLASVTHSSVSSGSTFCLASLTMTRNLASLPASSPKRSGSVGRELEDRAGLGAAQLVVELVDDHPGTDAVQEVGGGQPFDRLAVDRARDVDRGVRVVDERELGVGEIGEALAQRVDLLVDVVVGDGVGTAARRAARRNRRASPADGSRRPRRTRRRRLLGRR